MSGVSHHFQQAQQAAGIVGGDVVQLKWTYDFDEVGGAVGTHDLLDEFGQPQTFPAGTFFHYGYLESVVPLVTAGPVAQIKAGWSTDDDAMIPGTVAHNSIFFTGPFVGDAIRVYPDAGGGNIRPVRPAAESATITIADAPLTGGLFNWYTLLVQT